MTVHCLVFDIETVPDLDLGRRLYDLDGVEDNQVAQIMFTRRRQETGGEFLSLVQHRIVAISVALRTRESLRVWSLGEPQSSEKELIERFFDGIEKYSPDLVSWNGSGFDLPVLQYRALRHGVAAPRYWETGDDDQAFRYNNYLNRFHWRHLDLMDVLSGYQSRGRASLEDVAALLGLPGKVGMHGEEVWAHYRAGDLLAIRDYCEIDVINTYLIYLRFELIRGRLMPSEYERELAYTRECLSAQAKPHFARFLESWGAGASAGS
jgi:predicted PolB exonuclease-like 3'-5' exonuclease